MNLKWLPMLLALLMYTCGIASAQTGASEVFGVNASGQVMRWDGSAWVQAPGSGNLNQVSVGADGTVWGVNNAGSIFRLADSQWQQVPGILKQISVANAQNIWGVNANHDIYRWTGTQWQLVPGKLSNIAVAIDGSVYGVTSAGNVFRLANTGWQQMPGILTQISAGNAQNIWGVNASHDIFRWTGTQWQAIPGKLINIAAAANGAVWGVNSAGAIYRLDGSQWQQMPGMLSQIAAATATTSNSNQVASSPATGTVQLVLSEPTVIVERGQIQQAPSLSGNALLNADRQAVTVLGGKTRYTPGPVGKSQTVCGGNDQPMCTSSEAELMATASNNGNGCPTGSFMDIGKWSCWSCPDGFDRSAAAVDSERACSKPLTNPSGIGTLGPATYRGPLCPAGSFHDPIRGGECYSCPAGYTRSAAHIDAPNACYIRMGENFSRATRVKTTIWPHECASGTFWDGWSGGGCWTCPGGYKRTGYAIHETGACSVFVAEKQARATIVQKAQCLAGEFHDIKIPGTQDTWTGGGCYTCPAAWDRTIHPVDGKQACEKDNRFSWARATMVKASLVCDAGQIYDPINTSHADVKKKLNGRDINSTIGTCWKCPPASMRTAKAVYGADACTPPDIQWKSAEYRQPGLFGLEGGEEVALALIRERTLINQASDGMAPGLSKSSATMRAEAWDEIATEPWASPVLTAAVLARLQDIAINPTRATPAEKQLLVSSAAAIKNFRILMAQDALDAHDAWNASIDWRVRNGPKTREQGYNMTPAPPDFEQITAEHIMGALAAGGGITAAGGLTLMSDSVQKTLFPFRLRKVLLTAETKPAVTVTSRAAALASKTASTNAAKQAASAAAKVGSRVAGQIASKFMSAGPQVIITFAIELLSTMIEQEIDKRNARPQLVTNLATAKNREIDFARMLGTEKGGDELESSWSMIMSGTNIPKDGGQFNRLALAAKAEANAGAGNR